MLKLMKALINFLKYLCPLPLFLIIGYFDGLLSNKGDAMEDNKTTGTVKHPTGSTYTGTLKNGR